MNLAKNNETREIFVTPWKINMEPTNQPFRMENDLPNLHDYVPAVNLPGCNSSTALLDWINFFLEDVTLAVGM